MDRGSNNQRLFKQMMSDFNDSISQAKQNSTFNIKIKTNIDEANKKFSELNNNIAELDKVSKYFQSEDNALSIFIEKWNDLISDNQGKKISDLVDISNRDSNEVYRLATAFEALGGDLSTLPNEMQDFVNSMRQISKNPAFSLDNMKNAFDGIKDLLNNDYIDEFQTYIQHALQMPDIKLLNIDESIDDATEKIKDSYDDQAKAAEESSNKQIESEKRELEALENIQKARQQIDKERKSYYTDDDYNDNSSYFYKIRIDQYDTEAEKIQHLIDLQERLIEERNNNEVSYYEDQYKNEYLNGNFDEADSQLENFKSELQEYNNLTDKINYVSDRLIELRQDFVQNNPISETWDGKNIQILIESIRLLIQQVEKLSQSFGKIDEKNGISSLLSQLKEIGENIPKAFDDDTLKSFKNTLDQITNIINNLEPKLNEINNDTKSSFSLSEEDKKSYQELFQNIKNISEVLSGLNKKTINDSLDNEEAKDFFEILKNILSVIQQIAEQFQEIGFSEFFTNQSVSEIKDVLNQFKGENFVGLNQTFSQIEQAAEKLSAMLPLLTEMASKVGNIKMQFDLGGESDIEKWYRNNINRYENFYKDLMNVASRYSADISGQELLFGTLSDNKKISGIYGFELQDIFGQAQMDDYTKSFEQRFMQYQKFISVLEMYIEENKNNIENAREKLQPQIEQREKLSEILKANEESRRQLLLDYFNETMDEMPKSYEDKSLKELDDIGKQQLQMLDNVLEQEGQMGIMWARIQEMIKKRQITSDIGSSRSSARKYDSEDKFKKMVDERRVLTEALKKDQEERNKILSSVIKVGANEQNVDLVQRAEEKIAKLDEEIKKEEEAKKRREELQQTIASMSQDTEAKTEFYANIITSINNITQAIKELQDNLKNGFKVENEEQSVSYFQKLSENIGKIAESSEHLKDSFTVLASIFGNEKATVIGVNPDRVQNIIDKFKGLETVLQSVHSLLKDSLHLSDDEIRDFTNNLSNSIGAESGSKSKRKRKTKTETISTNKKNGRTTVKTTEESSGSTDDIIKTGDAIKSDGAEAIKLMESFSSEAKRNIPGAMIDAAKDAADEVGKTYYNLGKEAVDKTKEALNEHSPSQEFIQIGEYTIEGFVIGVEENKDKVVDVLKGAFDIDSYLKNIVSSSSQESLVDKLFDNIIGKFDISDKERLREALTQYVNDITVGNNADASMEVIGKNTPGKDIINDRINLLQKLSNSMQEKMKEIYSEQIQPNQNEDYYKNLYADIEKVNEEISVLRSNLSSLPISQTDTSLIGQRDQILRQTQVVEGMAVGRKGQITEMYEAANAEISRAQAETEEQILQRQQQMIARITSHEDYEKYAGSTWLREYIDKAGEEFADLDQLYAEYEQRLAARKQQIIAEESEELERSFEIKGQNNVSGRKYGFRINDIGEYIKASTVSDVKKILDMIDQSVYPDKIISIISNYVSDRIKNGIEVPKNELDKLFNINRELNTRYDTPLIEDTRQKKPKKEKPDPLAQYKVSDEDITQQQDEIQHEMQETSQTAESTTEEINKQSDALNRLSQMYKEAGENEKEFQAKLKSLKKQELIDLVNESGFHDTEIKNNTKLNKDNLSGILSSGYKKTVDQQVMGYGRNAYNELNAIDDWVGEAASQAGEKIKRSQEEIQKEIDETNEKLREQEQNLQYIQKVIDDNGRDDFHDANPDGKRAATNKLRDKYNKAKDEKQFFDKESPTTTPIVKDYHAAYEEARATGVAQSVLDRYYDPEIMDKFIDHVKNVYQEYQTQIEETKRKLQELQQEMQGVATEKTGFEDPDIYKKNMKDFFDATINDYKSYIDNIAGGPEINSLKIVGELAESGFKELLNIVLKINEAFKQGKLDAEGYVEGFGYLDGMDWAKNYARYLTKDDRHGHASRYLEEVPDGWKEIKGALTAPQGYKWYSNGKSRFDYNGYQAALVKTHDQQEKIDPISSLTDKEQTAVSKYLQSMKTMLKDNYNEAQALKQALDLLTKIKSGDVSGIMDRFFAPNKASNAMLKEMTGMPVNNQANRDAALRSINPTQYDQIIRRQTESAKVELEKQKSEFDNKWSELVSHMIGGDVFESRSKMEKGKILKSLKDIIDDINKRFLAGQLEGKELTDRYAQQYLDALRTQRSEAEENREADENMASFDQNGNIVPITKEEIELLHQKAAAYDEMIAKKREYYGIKEESIKSDAIVEETQALEQQEQATTALSVIENKAQKNAEKAAEIIFTRIKARQQETESIKEQGVAIAQLEDTKESVITQDGIEVVGNGTSRYNENDDRNDYDTTGSFKKQFNTIETVVADEIEEFKKIEKYLNTDLVQAAKVATEAIQAEVKKVLEYIQLEIDKLEIVQGIINQLKGGINIGEQLGGENQTNTTYSNLGDYAVDGYVNTIKARTEDVVNAVAEFIKAGIESAKNAQDSHSDSVEYKKLADYAVDGYVHEISKRINEVSEIIKKMINAGISAAKEESGENGESNQKVDLEQVLKDAINIALTETQEYSDELFSDLASDGIEAYTKQIDEKSGDVTKSITNMISTSIESSKEVQSQQFTTLGQEAGKSYADGFKAAEEEIKNTIRSTIGNAGGLKSVDFERAVAGDKQVDDQNKEVLNRIMSNFNDSFKGNVGELFNSIGIAKASSISGIDNFIESLERAKQIFNGSTDVEAINQINQALEYLYQERVRLNNLGDESLLGFTSQEYAEVVKSIQEIREQIEVLKSSIQNNVGQDVNQQVEFFKKLKDILSKDLPKVIQQKNKSLLELDAVMQDIIRKEQQAFTNLNGKIDQIIPKVSNNLKADKLDTISISFEKFVNMLKTNSLVDFTTALNNLYISLSRFVGMKPASNSVFTQVIEMLKKGDAIKNFANILKESEEKIESVKEAVKENIETPKINTQDTILDEDEWDGALDKAGDLKDELGEIVKIIEHVRIVPEVDDEGNPITDDDGNVVTKHKLMSTEYFGTNKNAVVYNPDSGRAPEITQTTKDISIEAKKDTKLLTLQKIRQSLIDADAISEELETEFKTLETAIKQVNDHGSFAKVDDGLKKLKLETESAIKAAKDLKKANDEMYDSGLKKIKALVDERTKYNNMLVRNMIDNRVVTDQDLAAQKSRADNAAASARQGMDTIASMYTDGIINEEQYNKAKRLYDTEGQSGSERSQQSVRITQIKTEEEALKGLIKSIKDLQDARTALNAIDKDSINNGESTVTNRRAEAMSNLAKKTTEAGEAYKKLEAMHESGSLDDDTFKAITDVYNSKGSSASLDNIAKAIENQFNKAKKAVDAYENALEKVKTYQEGLSSGTSVSGRLMGAIRNMDADKDKAMEMLKILEEINKKYPVDGFEALKTRMGSYNDRYQEAGGTNIDVIKNRGFETAEKGYDTLSKRAMTYYKIQQKLASSKPLTANDQKFLTDNEKYFKDAAKGAKEFSKSLGEVYTNAEKTEQALKKAQEGQKKFNESSAEAMKSISSSTMDNLEKQISEMSGQDGTKAFNEAVIKIGEEFDSLSSKIQDIDWNGKSEEDFRQTMDQLNKIQVKIKELGTDEDYQPVNQVQRSRLSRKMAEWSDIHSGAKEANEQIKILQAQLKGIDSIKGFNAIEKSFEDIKQEAYDAGKAGVSFGDKIKQSFSNLGRYLLSFGTFYRVIDVFKQGVRVVREMDTAFTELRKVSEDSLSVLEKYKFETYGIADEVGTTASQIMNSTADWVRLGKTLQEGKELAALSTKLMNVSEFDNIESATQSLVSATQAYKDVSPEDIVDKLNLVGNNFAISTDELATGLQNAAAVLMTQGNDLDEALGLLTSGNLIGQDISKASAGIRTISLRISGTEEAKQQIADMGEDVDDFVVRTKSKTDQIIRDYTSVASNMYKGVSVLDANGNLRNTYDIK